MLGLALSPSAVAVRRTYSSGAAPSLDADASAWAAAVTANGGTYSAGTLAAVDTFVKAAKASGYWSKLNRINLFAGDQLAAALVPLKVGGGSAKDTAVNFVSGDYNEATGLTGNGSSKYLKTGLVPSTSLTLNDTHLAVYNRASSATGGLLDIGARGGANFFEMLAPHSDGTFIARAYDDTTGNGRVISAVLTAPYGLMVSSRASSTSLVAYRNGTSVASASSTGGALLSGEIYVFNSNNGGTPTSGGYTSHPLAAYSVGSGLSAADVTAYTAHMEAFQDVLGRGVQ